MFPPFSKPFPFAKTFNVDHVAFDFIEEPVVGKFKV
jgi:hypothetical protein